MVDRDKTKFGAIEVGRGVAACLVVFHHANDIISEPRFYGSEPYAGHLRNFNVGVDFFFVLSGFIIAWVHWHDIGDKSRLETYVKKRFLRIYPPYWGVLLPLIALYVMFPAAGVPSQHDPLNIVTSFFLLPNTYPPVLGVAWTLVHEIFFYAIFAAIIAIGRHGLWLLLIWAIAIVVGDFVGAPHFPISFVLNPFNIEFILGVGGALLLKHRIIPLPGLLVSAGIASFLSLMLFAVHIQDEPLVGRLAFGLPALLFVLGVVELERGGAIRLHPVLVFFGAASYAIYLVHPVALSFAIHALDRAFERSLPLSAVVFISALFAIGNGLAYHRFIEPVLTSSMRDFLRRMTSVRPRAPAAGL
jgi:exopolysaccharide production protein ExoZ